MAEKNAEHSEAASARMDGAAHLIEENVTRAGEGEQRLEELARSVTQLTPAARGTRERLDEVRPASREQTKGLGLIGSAMARLEQLTQQVAAGAEECAAASEELAGQAASMTPVVEVLRRMAG